MGIPINRSELKRPPVNRARPINELMLIKKPRNAHMRIKNPRKVFDFIHYRDKVASTLTFWRLEAPERESERDRERQRGSLAGGLAAPQHPISILPNFGDRWRPYPTLRNPIPTPPSRAYPKDDVRCRQTPSN